MEERNGAKGESPRLHVLMVHPHDLYSPQEPWTVRIRFLARELVKRGHTVTLAYHRLEGSRDLNVPGFPGVELLELTRNFSALGRNMRILCSYAKSCDVVHVQKCMPHSTIPALWAAYTTGRPVHYDWDDWEYKIQEIETNGRAPGWLKWMETRLPRLVDTVSVASEVLRGLALRAAVPEDRIFPAPVGADIEFFVKDRDPGRIRSELQHDGPLVLYLGQLHATQYVGQFLEAGAQLLKKAPDVLLVVVGAGWRLPELVEKAESMGISERVVFTGAVPYARIPDYLSAADVAVACFEDNEATRAKSPLKVVEYLAAGKAIVASSVGEVERMVSGCGVLVPPGDVNALSAAIFDLLSDPEERARLGRLAREKAEELHSWSAVAVNLEKAYLRALSL